MGPALTEEVKNIARVLATPVQAARPISQEPAWRVMLLLLGAGSAALGFLRSATTIQALANAQEGLGTASSLLWNTRFLAAALAPLGLLLKLLLVAFLVWGGIIFLRDVSFVRVFSAVVHAELPVFLGVVAHTGLLFSKGTHVQLEDLTSSVGLNSLFSGISSASPLGVFLGRVNPFLGYWVVFLVFWVRVVTGSSTGVAAFFVGGYWCIFTLLQMGMQILVTW